MNRILMADKMRFVSDEHKQFYKDHADIVNHELYDAALVYTLGISPSCREHFDRLYNHNQYCIIPAGLYEGWQTGSSARVTRLAFNLFTGETAPGDDPANYAPKELFSGLDSEHYYGMLLALMYFADKT